MKVYLDNSATTRCSERAKAILIRALTEDYGNPSALHGMGKSAEDYIRDAREKIAATLKVEEKELMFTSGGTESNNTAIIGAALGNPRLGRHIITTEIEHPSVREPFEALKELGYEITYLGVDGEGRISLEELSSAVREDTALVSIMMVNNEIGAVEPVGEAAKRIREKNPHTLFHVDAIQAYGKFRIYPKKLGIDLLSVSGHKIRAPKGTGFLYIGDKIKIKPLLYGGGQQKGLRSGTENVPGIAALGEAAAESYERLDETVSRLYGLRERLIGQIAQISGVTVNCAAQPAGAGHSGDQPAAPTAAPARTADRPVSDAGPVRSAGQPMARSGDLPGAGERAQQPAGPAVAPHIVSVTAEGVRSEVLLHALEDAGIYVSAGSACSSHKPAPSRTLLGIGLTKEQAGSTIRISMGAETTEEEVDYAAAKLAELVPALRRFTRR